MDINTTQRFNQTLIDNEFLNRILLPYKEDTSYLKKAFFEYDKKVQKYPTMKGNFEIPESCYIDDTGHFNAVEFNICFNQIGYTYLGHCVKEGLLPELVDFSDNNCEVFFEKQLSNILIVNIDSTYRKPINSDKFYGEIGIKTISKRANFTFIVMSCEFSDDGFGKSYGEVKLTVLNP